MEEPVTRAAEAPDFIIDEDTGGLLNTNTKGLRAYKEQRAAVRQSKAMYKRLEKLEASFDELKELLIKALNK